MVDTVDKATRSRIMSSIRSRGNKSTEGRLRMALVRNGITAWRMHAQDVRGNPDFVFDEIRLAVFVDGCFWHGCRKCGHRPKSNRKYWNAKLDRNVRRDRSQRSKLRREGWSVLRVWAHELDDLGGVARRVTAAIEKRKRGQSSRQDEKKGGICEDN